MAYPKKRPISKKGGKAPQPPSKSPAQRRPDPGVLSELSNMQISKNKRSKTPSKRKSEAFFDPPNLSKSKYVEVQRDKKLRKETKFKVFRQITEKLFNTRIDSAKLNSFLRLKQSEKEDFIRYDWASDKNVLNLRFFGYLMMQEIETFIETIDEDRGLNFLNNVNQKLAKRDRIISHLMREKVYTAKFINKMLGIFENSLKEMIICKSLSKRPDLEEQRETLTSKIDSVIKDLRLAQPLRKLRSKFVSKRDVHNLLSACDKPETREQSVESLQMLSEIQTQFEKMRQSSRATDVLEQMQEQLAAKETAYSELMEQYENIVSDFLFFIEKQKQKEIDFDAKQVEFLKRLEPDELIDHIVDERVLLQRRGGKRKTKKGPKRRGGRYRSGSPARSSPSKDIQGSKKKRRRKKKTKKGKRARSPESHYDNFRYQQDSDPEYYEGYYPEDDNNDDRGNRGKVYTGETTFQNERVHKDPNHHKFRRKSTRIDQKLQDQIAEENMSRRNSKRIIRIPDSQNDRGGNNSPRFQTQDSQPFVVEVPPDNNHLRDRGAQDQYNNPLRKSESSIQFLPDAEGTQLKQKMSRTSTLNFELTKQLGASSFRPSSIYQSSLPPQPDLPSDISKSNTKIDSYVDQQARRPSVPHNGLQAASRGSSQPYPGSIDQQVAPPVHTDMNKANNVNLKPKTPSSVSNQTPISIVSDIIVPVPMEHGAGIGQNRVQPPPIPPKQRNSIQSNRRDSKFKPDQNPLFAGGMSSVDEGESDESFNIPGDIPAPKRASVKLGGPREARRSIFDVLANAANDDSLKDDPIQDDSLLAASLDAGGTQKDSLMSGDDFSYPQGDDDEPDYFQFCEESKSGQ